MVKLFDSRFDEGCEDCVELFRNIEIVDECIGNIMFCSKVSGSDFCVVLLCLYDGIWFLVLDVLYEVRLLIFLVLGLVLVFS